MNAENEIEDMASALTGEVINNGDKLVKLGYIETKAIAELLVSAGIGNVKQAVKEFAEELKEKAKYKELKTCSNSGWDEGFNVIRKAISVDDIDELIKENYGE